MEEHVANMLNMTNVPTDVRQQVKQCLSGDTDLALGGVQVAKGKLNACVEKNVTMYEPYAKTLAKLVDDAPNANNPKVQQDWEMCRNDARDNIRRCGKARCPPPELSACAKEAFAFTDMRNAQRAYMLVYASNNKDEKVTVSNLTAAFRAPVFAPKLGSDRFAKVDLVEDFDFSIVRKRDNPAEALARHGVQHPELQVACQLDDLPVLLILDAEGKELRRVPNSELEMCSDDPVRCDFLVDRELTLQTGKPALYPGN